MFRSRFFWKLFLSYAIVIVLTVAAVGFLILREYRRVLSDRMELSLRNQCVALADLVDPDSRDRPEFEDRVNRFGSATERRITIVDNDGVVLADSDADASSMENHGQRPEILEAFENEFGVNVRESDTTGRGYLYVAHAPRGPDGNPLGIVRIALETSSLDADERTVRKLILFGAFLSSIVALLIVAYIVRRVAFPLEQMRAVVNSLSAGDYESRVPIDARSKTVDELGEMALALNRLGFDMRQRVTDLTAGQERLRAMVAGMVEGVVAVDEDDRVTFSNLAARKLLGFGPDTGTKRLWDVARVRGLDELLRAARRSNDAAECELELSKIDEDEIVRAQAHRFQDGDSMGVVVVLQDVSEIRKLERIRRDFVANVSHELKTPLTSIRGYVETLLDGAIDDEENNVRFLEKIEKNVLRLNHLVTDLLSLAKIEDNVGILAHQSVELESFVGEAIRRHENLARKRDQRLIADVRGESVRVLADREALTQIVDNLIDNGLKYSPDRGEVRVTVSQDDTHGILVVRDTGIGIPVEDQARIFERFYRVDKARSREVGGTGLGLSIVKHLVLALGGTIELESEPGEGSEFRVRLELAADEQISVP